MKILFAGTLDKDTCPKKRRLKQPCRACWLPNRQDRYCCKLKKD